jgi:calcineurin-like phosphoesterase family protein
MGFGRAKTKDSGRVGNCDKLGNMNTGHTPPTDPPPFERLRTPYMAHLATQLEVGRKGSVAGKETRRGMRQGAEWARLTREAWAQFGQAWEHAPQDVFVWSDLHLLHDNIIGYTDRPFGSVTYMDNCLLANAQETVTDGQWLLFVGDLAMWKDRATIEAWMGACPGRKALVLGNHDVRGRERPVRVEDWQSLGFEAVADVAMLPAAHSLPELLITHYPLPKSAIDAGQANVHGHTHTEVFAGPYVSACVEITGYRPSNMAQWVSEQLARTDI